jgi:hypothetical protein
MHTNEPEDPQIEAVYEAPRVEVSLTPESLAREIQYAGFPSGVEDVQDNQQF